ncbi:MAG: hypothetical protein LKM32_01505 [Chiayiivirga sp.]|jgi:uncharacterized membrane protein|uniref:hypothetical protein n=1 Tax=Chiayiivirga sp. TaxID=2041042 RepID=UPI0025C7128B|nr:hypothetical protein [Chiayiivirga sp.]MCI1711091.1 hypothetical protein [Chiayiivirga sp.]MCI1728111.1 hypothetical protein [Chiayiivirga sp.]
MDQEELYRRIAINSGSVVVVIGLSYFFFSTDAAADLSPWLRLVAALIGTTACLIGLRVYFLQHDKARRNKSDD